MKVHKKRFPEGRMRCPMCKGSGHVRRPGTLKPTDPGFAGNGAGTTFWTVKPTRTSDG